MLQRLIVAMSMLSLVAKPTLGLSFWSQIQGSIREEFNFHKVSQACLNFLPTELVWALQNKDRLQGNVEYSQGVCAQIPTQTMCKCDNLIIVIDTKASIQLEVKTSAFI